ncbi:MAG: AlkA N-terminal domain-containing protein [Myxococcota bacterium]|nr:AlkA N-terminal domain-containing protein [Myxococcota bacterium]
MLDQDACYRALQTRDARFDGRFFTAVRSTGVFCRPVCPARTPKRENCIFVACAAAARELGFRPCLRCRPEASPGTPAWLGTSATVSRALRLIADGALDDGSVARLAERLGIGERHLRRLFLTHLGASPLAVAQTRRLLFAKQLIDETSLPMAQVAFAAGFSSIRRFNSAVREAWSTSPSSLRRGRRGDRSDASEIALRIGYRPPFAWDRLLGFLAPRATPGVERVAQGRYGRTIAVAGAVGVVEVEPATRDAALVARVRLSRPAPLVAVAERLRRVFDCGAEPAVIAAHLSRDPQLARLLRATPGIRVPGAWDGFELAVRAILGQQVSVAAATRLAARLVRAYGEPLDPTLAREGLDHVFPRPEALADADPDTLGVPAARAAAIRGLARAVAKGDLALDGAQGLDESLRQLEALPGLGEWTAQYVAMRALGEPDAFPATDLGIRKALGRGGRPASAAEVRERAEAWRPWRAYAALLLWGSLH